MSNMRRARAFALPNCNCRQRKEVPWHSHTNISDTFYVLSGHMRLFLNNPKQEVNLNPGDVFVAKPERPHMVTNGGTTSLDISRPAGYGGI